MAQLALAWVARFPTTSTVILGATRPEQLLENLKALEVVHKLTPEVLAKIDCILGNAPAPEVSGPLPSLAASSRLQRRVLIEISFPPCRPPGAARRWTSTEGSEARDAAVLKLT